MFLKMNFLSLLFTLAWHGVQDLPHTGKKEKKKGRTLTCMEPE